MTPKTLSERVYENLLGQLVQLEEGKKDIIRQCLRSVSGDPWSLEEELNLYEKKLRALVESAVKEKTDDSWVPFVTVGSDVSVRDEESGEVMEYRLVSPSAFELEGNDVTYLSPIGRAFLLKSVGDEAVVGAPKGVTRYRICGISLRSEKVSLK